MTTAALYARVSLEKQVQENTIASQVDALKSRMIIDGFTLLEEYQFIDNGYSGSNLVRPALEKLRDQAASGTIDKIYIHSPDRLSRKYAYQMSYAQQYIIKDEFEPRIKTMRQNLKVIQDQQNKLTEQKNLTREMELIVTNLYNFACGINSKLDGLDWNGKRGIIRRVVKRIEISGEEINIVYKINKLPDYENDASAQHCCNRTLRS